MLQTAHFRLILLALGMVCFLPFLGQAPLFDWDEVNFAESAREMLLSGNYTRVQVNFQPFWEKPPLFIWMQVLSMKLFGVNEYAARFPNALFGIVNLLLLFELGRRLRSDRFGFLWALGMLGAFLPHVYFKSGIIDPVFNTFIFLGIWNLYKASRAYGQPDARKHALFAGLHIGLAILTKGPVGLLIPLLTTGTFWIMSRLKPVLSFINMLLGGLVALLVTAFWFGPETLQHGTWFLEAFVRYQIRLFSTPDAGHAQPFYYHFVVVLLGCFPVSVPALRVLFRRVQARLEDPDFLLWMKCLLWMVLLLFSIVTTKIVHYSSMAYLPLSALAAVSFEEFLRGRQQWSGWQALGFLMVGMVLGLVMLILPYAGMHTALWMPLLKDPFAVESLQIQVVWHIWDYLPGFIWMLGTLLGAWYLWKQRRTQAIAAMFSGSILATSLFLIFFPARIAEFTQQSAVHFAEALKGQDIYLETLRHKSFAQYFYFGKTGMSKAEQAHCRDAEGNYHIDTLRGWYLTGEIDKPVYFIVKSMYYPDYQSTPGLEIVDRKGGFMLLRRMPPQISR